MTLEDLGNLGEFVGAIAVGVSLLYLAVQIRQKTRATRSSSIQAANMGIVDTVSLIARHPQVADVVTPDELAGA